MKMGVKIHNDITANAKYKFHRKAGRSIIDRRPVFSPDGESLLIIVENTVRVYSVQTGECVRTLETESHANELVAIQFLDNEHYNLYGCSGSGCVTTWTWENGVVLRETNLPIPEIMKVLTFDLLDSNECFIAAARPTNKYLHLGLYSLKTRDEIYNFNCLKIYYYENMIRVAVGWCNGNRFAAITCGTPRLFIQNLNQPHIYEIFQSLNQIRVISVAVHHNNSDVAIVDALGRTTIYRGNLFDRHNCGREVLHWHFLPTLAVCFSMQGSYVYTGGMEKVLVKWTTGNLATRANEKVFIPRLPGMIRFIATSNTHVAAALTNNSVVIANLQLRVVSTLLECGGLSPAARACGAPLLAHARLGGLLVGGRPGHLQLYSTATDKVLYNIDITGMNDTPPERHNLLPMETEVTSAAVSGNGSWLVTSEYRNDGATYPEERLKFWSLQVKDAAPFKLNTCVNLSHGGCIVVSIALNIGNFCVTAGADQKLRIWKRETTSQKHMKKVSWNCITACYYSSGIAHYLSHGILNNFKIGKMPPGRGAEHPYLRDYVNKNDIVRKIVNIHKEHWLLDESVVNAGMRLDEENDMGAVAISQDGSLIATWFGCKLTLWDSHLCNLRTALSHPVLRPKGLHVKFGNQDAAHYLVCTTNKCMAVWSLISLTVKWIVEINPSCLAADPLSNKMAVVTTNNDVYIFTPHSPKPILTQKRLMDPRTGVFKQCTFGTTSGDDIRLYMMRNDSEIYTLEPEQPSGGRLEVISRRNLPVSNFSALLAEQRLSEVQPATVGSVQTLNGDALSNSAVAQFLSAAPHMVPPVSMLCTSFLQHISGHEQTEPAGDQQDSMEVDESSSEDEQDVETTRLNGPYAPKAVQLWTANYEKVKEKRLQKVKDLIIDLHSTEAIFGV